MAAQRGKGLGCCKICPRWDAKYSGFHLRCFVLQARRPAETGSTPEISHETPSEATAKLEGPDRILWLREGECPHGLVSLSPRLVPQLPRRGNCSSFLLTHLGPDA